MLAGGFTFGPTSGCLSFRPFRWSLPACHSPPTFPHQIKSWNKRDMMADGMALRLPQQPRPPQLYPAATATAEFPPGDVHAHHTHDLCFRFDVRLLLLWNERPIFGRRRGIYLSYLSISFLFGSYRLGGLYHA